MLDDFDGHFLAEERPDETVRELLAFLPARI